MMPFKGKESKKEEAKEMKSAGSKKMYMKMEKAEGKKSISFKPCPGCRFARNGATIKAKIALEK